MLLVESRMGLNDGGLALCKLMPLDNDTCDVKMPSLKGKSWAGTNGDWVVYIGLGLNEPAMLAEVMTSHRSMSSPTTSSFRSGQDPLRLYVKK